MNVLLQKHGAKHIYKVPEGLRELCTDIAREVIRSQPRNIYCFIADYVEALLITRENAKVAVKVVNNILLGSQAIVSILYRSGLSLEQIARVAPRIQRAFRAYLDTVDMRACQMCDGNYTVNYVEKQFCGWVDAELYDTCDEKSRISLQNILQATGTSPEQAEKSAIIIQAAFRGHYERMLLNESQGMVQWQRAATRTMEILRKAGASQAEASRAAILIQATYRGYYTRRNLKMKMRQKEKEDEKREEKKEEEKEEAKENDIDTIEPRETIQAVAWLDMMYEDSGLTQTKANEAASIIQKAYRRYRKKKEKSNTLRIESTRSMVVNPVAENLTQTKANKAASIIQKAYRRYRKKKEKSNTLQIESTRSMVVDPVAENLTQTKANKVASIIQKAYREYRKKKEKSNTPRIESTRSMMVNAIVKNLHQKVFDDVMTSADIPTEFGNREDLTKASEELQRTLKDRLTRAHMMEEGYNEQKFIRPKVSELFAELKNYDLEDREEGREIEVETEREETYVRD